jgi:hypothetical protein
VVTWLLAGCQDDTYQTPLDMDASMDTRGDGGGGDLAGDPDASDGADADTIDVPDADSNDATQDVEDEPDIEDEPDVVPDTPADIPPDAPEDMGIPDVPPPRPIYLVHINNFRNQLWLIDVDTLEITVACEFIDDARYPSSTFGLDGSFYGSRNAQFLDEIDPCTCEVTFVGDTGYEGVVGITANGVKEWELYGLSNRSNFLITIDNATGIGTGVGEGLGRDFGASGTTWSADIAGLFAINAVDDTLYRVDPLTGLAYMPIPINADFSTVGIEWHPSNGKLYACTNSALFRIDTVTGEASHMLDLEDGCNNLAAPWQPVECLDALLEE